MRNLRNNCFPIGWFIFLTFASCKNEQKDHHGQSQGYHIVENADGLEDCSVYSMMFDHDSEYIFRFALSGTCPALTPEIFMNSYTGFLKKYHDSLDVEKGKLIRLDFYRKAGIDLSTI